MKKNLNTAIVSGVFLLIFGISLFAVEHVRTGYEGMARYLGLSASQVASIDQEVGNFEKAQQPAFAKLHQCEGEMERAIQSGDASTIGKLSLDRIALNRQINEERKSMQNRIRSILNPQQAEKLDHALEVLRVVGINDNVLGPLGLGASEGETLVHKSEEIMRSDRTSEGKMNVPGGGGIVHSHPRDNQR